MGSYQDKLAKQIGHVLEPGESVVAAAKFLPAGRGKRRALGAAFGVLGAAAAGHSGAAVVVGGRPLPGNLALAVTDRRLLVFALSEATEKATELTHRIPRTDIRQVRWTVGRSFGMKAVQLTVDLADGSRMEIEAPQPHAGQGEEFARTLSPMATIPA